MATETAAHPCFDSDARHTVGRIHLPVAPSCNVQCNYCNRRFDCVAESRPGVSSAVLRPEQAAAWCTQRVAERPEIGVVGIAGPGDPFANADRTLETLALVREHHPEMRLCVASNGLMVEPHAAALAELEVGHVTITLSAVDPAIAGLIYGWVRYEKRMYRGSEAGELLLERQLAAIRALKANGVVVKINTIVMPGINERHVEQVAQAMAELGADVMNLMPMYRVAGTPFADLAEPHPALMASLRAMCGAHLPQMAHCQRCRADASGLLDDDEQVAAQRLADWVAAGAMPAADRPYVAVASEEGMLVNQHLGAARHLRIYELDHGQVHLVGSRQAPESGLGASRWEQLAAMLTDCRALLCYQLGAAPRRVLAQMGVACHETDGLVEDAVVAVYAGQELPVAVKRKACAAGGCGGGPGTGC